VHGVMVDTYLLPQVIEYIVLANPTVSSTTCVICSYRFHSILGGLNLLCSKHMQ
jgi:hypothetical protein